MPDVPTMPAGSASAAPVRDETLTVDGLRFHYRDWGDAAAPPLLLLHGGTMHARIWDTFAPAMADRFRPLALDLRGHGESEWAADYTIERFVTDIEEFADRLGLERFALVGYSIGGRLGSMYAARHPDRVERLALVEVCLWPPLKPDAQEGFALLRALPDAYADLAEAIGAYRPLVPRAPDDVLGRWVADGLKADSDDRLVWRIDPYLRQQPRPPGMVSPSWDILGPLLPRITCQTLLVCGAGSFTRADTETTAPLMQRARIAYVPDAGHYPPLENPGGFLAAVRPFLLEG